MKNIIKLLVATFGTCVGLGFIVSLLEKKKGKVGWVEGHKPYGTYEKHIKRPMDFALALFSLLFLWPVLLIIAFAVRINMGSPVIFEQPRPGLGGKIFKIKKFRTMTDERDSEESLLPDENRLTKFGKSLRAISIDELPELINIIRGDMSVIGPRPQLVRDMVFMTDEQCKRHDVRPGLSGLAQVMGRNAISWEEKFEWDLKYVNKISLVRDIRIILMTLKKISSANNEYKDETDLTCDYGDELLNADKVSEEEYHMMQKKAIYILQQNEGGE